MFINVIDYLNWKWEQQSFSLIISSISFITFRGVNTLILFDIMPSEI